MYWRTFAVARAERDLKSLIDRAPRIAHRRQGSSIADIPIEQVVVGDVILVRAGEVIPIDGIIISPGAMIDEAVLTGEPIPVTRREGESARSGTVNAGETFEIRATATAGESTYAGIVRLVNAAQTAKAPFIRLADRYALLLFPITLVVAGGAWLLSGDPIRGLAVLVAATPCPLILAAPVAFIAGVAQAARLGILIKGGKPFEALARTHTVMFDKTGTLTVGGARLVAIETAPGESPEDVLRMAGSVGASLTSCRRGGHCGGRSRQGSRAASSVPSARDHGIRAGGYDRRPSGPSRIASIGLWGTQAGGVGRAGPQTRGLALRSERLRGCGRPHDRRLAARR